MSERVKDYFKKLKGLSSEDLESKAKEIVLNISQNNFRLIAHIAEIGERKYHLKVGYSNLFDYCHKRLNLSKGSIWRRTQVSRVCRLYPEILEAIYTNTLNLTAASLIAPHLKPNNIDELINAVKGKTKKEIKKYLIRFAHNKVFKSSYKKLSSSNLKNMDSQKSEETLHTEVKKLKVDNLQIEEKNLNSEEGFNPVAKPSAPVNVNRPQNILEPATEALHNIRFSASNKFVDKLERLAEVLGIESPGNHLEDIFELALEIALDKKDPKRKFERRQRGEAKKMEIEKTEQKAEEEDFCPEKTCLGEISDEKPENKKLKAETTGLTPESSKAKRYIPSEVRERLLEKAYHQCEYVSPEGVRCSSGTGLQIDHILPHAVSQSNDEENLRVLCRAHNRFAAEEFFGSDFIGQKIKEQRQEKVKQIEVKQTVGKTCVCM